MNNTIAVECSGTVAVATRRMATIPNLGAFLNAGRILPWPEAWLTPRPDAVAGWGCRRTADRARHYARRHVIPFLAIEDGFLRSPGLGGSDSPPLSLVVDDLGIYYDASRPSRLEELLNDQDAITEDMLQLADATMATIHRNRLSKYNNGTTSFALPGRPGRRVLLIDQTRDDMSVLLGGGDESAFLRMFDLAQAENPDADILVKLHPETIAGRKAGYLAGIGLPRHVSIIDKAVNPIALLEECERVYTVSSQLGLEALTMGLPVTCMGLPFYAGWGATDDRKTCPRREMKRTPREIFAAAYLQYARYVDPVTGKRCGIERVIELLTESRRIGEANRGTTICLGMQRWKKSHLRPFLAGPDSRIIFARNGKAALRKGAARGDRILVWGDRKPAGLETLSSQTCGPVGRVEDGFLRSIGLGSDFLRPHSLTFDWQGAHFDPEHPSDLESLLIRTDFSDKLLARAAVLRQRILTAGLSKYNVGRHPPRLPDSANGRRIVLVPGQVEDDASVRLGSGEISSNLGLLRAVRAAEPDAFIVYKPHPEIIARNRLKGGRRDEIVRHCDAIWAGSNIHDCLRLADAVHVLTSLAGFEALLHGKPVTVHGGPFYAGWGLTEDRMAFPRRQRRLTLDELVAGALMLYPRYYDWKSRTLCDADGIASRLSGTANRQTAYDASPFLRPDRLILRLARLVRETVHA